MKAVLIFAAVLLFINLSNAQEGKIDSSFGNRGKVIIGSNLSLNNIAVDKNDNTFILYNKEIDFGIYKFFIQKFKPGGNVDFSFGNNGIIKIDFDTTEFQSFSLNQLIVQSDGKISMCGSSEKKLIILRFTKNGLPDKTFGSNGIASIKLNDEYYSRSMLQQSDGKLLVAIRQGFLYRFNANGSLDSSYGKDGKSTAYLFYIGAQFKMALQPNDEVILAGSDYVDFSVDIYSLKIARIKTNGMLDSAFGNNGTSLEYPFITNSIRSLFIQNDQKVLLAASGSNYYSANPFLLRLTNTGKRDSSFNKNGLVDNKPKDGQYLTFTNTLLQQQNGDILALGRIDSKYFYNHRPSVIRYNYAGIIDSAYFKSTNIKQESKGEIISAAFQKNGDIILGGYSNGTSSHGTVWLSKIKGENTFNNTLPIAKINNKF